MSKHNKTAPVAPVEGGVKARVLVDGAFGKVDDVVEVTAEQVAASGGELDANPAAVEWAEAQAAAIKAAE